MKTVVLPNGKEVVQNRLPKEVYMRLRTQGKEINRKRAHKRQDARRIIEEQLADAEE